MIIAIPLRGLRPNKCILRSPNFSLNPKRSSPQIHYRKKSSAKNKKAHSLRVGRILLIRIAITETPPATPVGGL